jgi:GINS complex subunit 1
MDPPKELLIQVRVLENFGEVMTENGPIVLVKGASHFIRRTDVEHLIRQGILEHVRSDEF